MNWHFRLHPTEPQNQPPMINNTVSTLRFSFKVDRPDVTKFLTTIVQPT
jgi:hypothetical protein